MSQALLTESLVLKSINFKDTDKIYTLFTRDFGKISGIGKGVRKISSKRLSLLDSLNLIKIGIAGKNELRVITEVRLIHSFINIKSNYQKLKTALYFLELISSHFQESDQSSEVFELLIKVLLRLDELAFFDSRVENYFEIELLRLSGFEVGLFSCSECSLNIDNHRFFNLNTEKNSLVCSKCLPSFSYLSEKDLSGISLLTRKIPNNEVLFSSLDPFLKNQIQILLSINIKSLTFFD